MEYRRPSLIGPLILITIGVLFLLANMGMLPFTFWEIAVRFWPLLLILVGLDIIIGRRSTLGGLVILVLWIALIGGLIWLASPQGAGFLPGAAAVSEPLSQPLGDIRSASVTLNVGMADTVLKSLGSDSVDLMNGTVRHPEGTRVVRTYQVVGEEGRLTLYEEGFNFFLTTTGFGRWDIGLNPAVPLVLTVNGGVGRSALDLSGLRVTSLSVHAGVGSIDVAAPNAGFVTIRLSGGVGPARVVIPPGMPARIRVHAGLGGISVDQSRFPRFGEVYQSADFASATDKIDVEIDGGVGGISIQ